MMQGLRQFAARKHRPQPDPLLRKGKPGGKAWVRQEGGQAAYDGFKSGYLLQERMAILAASQPELGRRALVLAVSADRTPLPGRGASQWAVDAREGIPV